MEKQIIGKKCVSCGTPLRLGKFAYNQDTCWGCFKMEVESIQERINEYPSWCWDKRDKHKEILRHMLSITAEMFGEKL